MKGYIKALLIVGSLMSLTRACNNGCLRCDSSAGSCIVCDFQRSYVPDGLGGCTVRQIVGCINTDASGGCFVCDNGRYYDPTSKTCIVSSTIANCRRYSAASTCSTCVTGYYLSGNACVKIQDASLITNCSIYDSASTCLQCRSGSIPVANRTSCFGVNMNTCSNYSYHFCNRCDSTKTLKNKNAYLIPSFDMQNMSDIRSIITKLTRGATNSPIYTSCIPTTVENCKTFLAYNKCKVCNDEYFLTDAGLCQAYTTESIFGCDRYLTKNICIDCLNGYYLKDSTCVESTYLENCNEYQTDADGCAECGEIYFYSEGACLERQYITSNCTTYMLDADKCTGCLDGYEVSIDALSCVQLPDDCAEYDSDLLATGVMSCVKCRDNYYYNSTSCVLGTVPNCLEYKPTENSCDFCITDFSVLNGQCAPNDLVIPNCDVYFPELPTRCKTCDFKSLSFDQQSVCKAFADISNCVEFSDLLTCSKCALGFVLGTTTCDAIPDNENCLKKEDGKCTLCKEGYQINSGACVEIPNIYTSNCANPDPSTEGVDFKCNGCAENYVPVNHKSHTCVKPAQFGITTVENCLKYGSQLGAIVCEMCIVSKVLSSDMTTCLETCPDGEIKYMGVLKGFIEDTDSVAHFARCVSKATLIDIPDGCDIASHDLKGSGNVCLKCASNYVPTEACRLNNSFFNPDNLSELIEGQAFPTVDCVLRTDDTKLVPTSASPDPNCLFYAPEGNSFYCRQCKFGHTGTIHKDGDGKYYLDCNDTISGCDHNIRIGSGYVEDMWIASMYGFNLVYEFTCHKCTDTDKIPFIHLSDDNTLLSYQINSEFNVPSQSTTLDGEMTVCRNPSKEDLFVDDPNFEGFVTNCALGLIVVDMAKSVTITESSVRCLACKDGYTPVYDLETGFFITSCESIENCTPTDTDGWFNGCKNCTVGYTKEVDEDRTVIPNLCGASTSLTNCKLYDTFNNLCFQCDQGYTLDLDGLCTKMVFPYCTDYSQNSEKIYHLNFDIYNYTYIYYYGTFGDGCISCSDDHVSFMTDLTDPICVFHPDLAAQSTNESSSYIDYCSSYFMNSQDATLCHMCASGYVVNQANNTCYDDLSLTGCVLSSVDGLTCAKCQDNFYLATGVCYEKTISNCAEYSVTDTTLNCTECNSGYVFNTNACSEGSIQNCDVFDNDGTCNKCKEGFYLLFNNCLAIPTFVHCKVPSLVLGSSNSFTCDICETGYNPETVADPTTEPLCLEGPLIDYCSIYDLETFECKSCESDYYLSQNTCITRTVTPAGCENFATESDSCQHCRRDFYLEDDDCIEILNNVDYCIKYTGESTCGLCTRNKYLFNNTCLDVPETDKIVHCEYYTGEKKCFSCEDGYISIGNNCKLIVAQNCSDYLSANVCKSCAPNLILTDRDNVVTYIRDCVQAIIENCAEINTFSGLCNSCDEGYYPTLLAKCAEVTSPITNCKTHRTASRCNICKDGYIRSIDGLSCTLDENVAATETNCLDLRYRLIPTCNSCRSGFYFSSNFCVQCNTNKVSSGCMFCNPLDNSICLVCVSGYYMTTSQTCELSSSGVEAAFDEDEDESSGIIGTMTVFLSMLLLIIKS